ncbi:MAG: hypothetical protein HYT80_03510 [Euryarchaeota archaeon]|nr:hypothetical protein [Euryarchaeota archaeon]
MNARAASLLVALFVASSLVPSVSALGFAPLPIVDDALPDGTSMTPSPSSAPATTTVAPFGVVPKADVLPMDSAMGPLPEGPYADLLASMADTPEMTPQHLAAYVADYFQGVGFETPGSNIEFEENATLAYSHVLGDVDGDGYDDVLLDQYCNVPDACRPSTPIQFGNPTGYIANQKCAWPHEFIAKSGRSGEPLWNVSNLDANHPRARELGLGSSLGCGFSFVVGTVPDPETGMNDVIVYTWQTFYPSSSFIGLNVGFGFNRDSLILTESSVYSIGAAEGRVKWRAGPFTGHWLENDGRGQTGTWIVSAHNLFVNPLLNVPHPQGVRIVPKDTLPGLNLQGVGFNMTYQIGVGLPYQVAPHTLLYDYQPNEWAMGLDPVSGQKRYWRETFQPNERIGQTAVTPGTSIEGHPGPRVPHGNRSVWPVAFQTPPLPFTRCIVDATVPCPPPRQWTPNQWNTLQAPARTQNYYWGVDPCCFDITGDSVPDIVYTVYEWTSTPIQNYDGPFMVAGRIIAFNGADGNIIFNRYTTPGSGLGFTYPPPPGRATSAFRMGLEYLGDANGDGASDFFLHEWFQTWDYRRNLTIINGVDGEPMWQLPWPRAYQVQPMGDMDKDGGADFIFFDYTFDFPGNQDSYSRANVTFTPISVYDGDTGERKYQTETFQAPNDLLYFMQQYRINGVPDFDGDDVGDIWLDDPLYLPDLTTLHRFTVVSGASNTPIFKIVSAGAFAFPVLVGDITQDGNDDFFMINGESIDIWGTTYYGNNGTAIWSRRVVATRTSSYAQAEPNLKSHFVHNAASPTQDFLLNFHFRVVSATCFSGFCFFIPSNRPQLTLFGGVTGTVPWSLPSLYDVNMTVMVPGMSPASLQYQNAVKFDGAKDKAVDPDVVSVPQQVLVGGATFGAAFGASFLLAGRRWRF